MTRNAIDVVQYEQGFARREGAPDQLSIADLRVGIEAHLSGTNGIGFKWTRAVGKLDDADTVCHRRGNALRDAKREHRLADSAAPKQIPQSGPLLHLHCNRLRQRFSANQAWRARSTTLVLSRGCSKCAGRLRRNGAGILLRLQAELLLQLRAKALKRSKDRVIALGGQVQGHQLAVRPFIGSLQVHETVQQPTNMRRIALLHAPDDELAQDGKLGSMNGVTGGSADRSQLQARHPRVFAQPADLIELLERVCGRRLACRCGQHACIAPDTLVEHHPPAS